MCNKCLPSSRSYMVLVSFFLLSCATWFTNPDNPREGINIKVCGRAGEIIRNIIGHDAVTLGPVSIFTKDPSPYLQCHEDQHKGISIKQYMLEFIDKGYKGNRFEIAAHEACKDLPGAEESGLD